MFSRRVPKAEDFDRIIMSAFLIMFFFFHYNPQGFALPFPTFPASLDSDCLIHMIVPEENYYTNYLESRLVSSFSENISSNYKGYVYTWTIHHDLNQLNFSISKTELMEDEQIAFTINQHYFRFFFKYQAEQCKLVIIFAESMNATVTAVNAVGYGTSSNVLYFVGVDTLEQNRSEILQGFSQDLHGQIGQELAIVPFHAPLAFFSMRDQEDCDENTNATCTSILVYCYFCPPEIIGKFHPINVLLEEKFPSVSQVKDYWSIWNSQGYGNKIVLHSPGDWEYKDATRINCTRMDRKMYNRLDRCHYAEMLVYNILDDVLNMTYTEFRDIFKDLGMDNVDDWYLNINNDEWSMGKVVVNVFASTRGTYHIFQEMGYKFIYCNLESKMTSLAWDIFLHVIDGATWLALLAVIGTYAILTGKLFYSMDLIWPLLGMSTWRTHSRLIMSFYLVAVGFFLQSSYNSGTSADFIQLMQPMLAPTLFKNNYKTWIPGVSHSPKYARLIYSRAPEFLKKRVHELIGGKDIEDILYKPAERFYSMPRRPLEMIRDMVKRRLMVISVGLPRYNSLMQVFGFVNWALITDDKKNETYLCSGVGVPIHIRIPDRRHASRTWGYLADKAADLVRRWFEMGFVRRMQTLLDHKLVLRRPIKWADAGTVSEQLPVKVNSPLGITCLCLVMINLINLACFLALRAWKRKSEIWDHLKLFIVPQYVQTDWLA